MKARFVAGPLAAAGAALVLLLPPAAQPQDMALPKADAQALWAYLQKQDYTKSFRHWPGKDKLYKGIEPHGAWLTTYVNEPALKALNGGGSGPLPAGSIVVKENYLPEKKLAAVTVMYKVEGFDPAHNDWFWLKRSAAGQIEASGKVDGCIGCHSASRRDYLLTPLKR